VYIIVAIVRIENFIYFLMPAFIVKTYGFSPVLSTLVMLVLGTSFAYSRFVVEKFTVQKKRKKNQKTKKLLFLQNKFIGMCIRSKI